MIFCICITMNNKKSSTGIVLTPRFSNRQCLFRHNTGFTLLELLISITLLTVIIVLMISAVRIGSRSMAAGEKKIDVQERFRSAVFLMDAQIQSQIPLTYQEEGKTKYYFKAGAKTLRFATNYSIWGGKRGYVIADYKIENDGSGKDILNA
ncbi:MAG: prepilin-type N-terminal cleavage/methylation domain-containing protein [Smithella sp.]